MDKELIKDLRKFSLWVVFGTGICLFMSGCATEVDPFSGERQKKDELPGSVVTQLIDRETSRYAGSAYDADFFIGHSNEDQSGICLIGVQNGANILEGCSASAPFSISASGLTAEYGLNYQSERQDSMVQIKPFLAIGKNGS